MTAERRIKDKPDAIPSEATQLAWQRTYARRCMAEGFGEDAASSSRLHGENALSPEAQRTRSDSEAAWRHWHQPDARPTLNSIEFPWYQLLEQARVEELACRDLPGMALNLSDLDALSPRGSQPARLYQQARKVFAEAVEQGQEAVAAVDLEQEQTIGPQSLTNKPDTPRQGWLDRLLRRTALPPTSVQPDESLSAEDILAALRQASVHLRASHAFAASLLPLIRRLAQAPLQPSADDFGPGEPISREPSSASLDPAVAQEDGEEASQPRDPDVMETDADETGQPPEAPNGPEQPVSTPPQQPAYHAYSTQWDEERTAQSFLTAEDREALLTLDPLDQARIRRLALQLQRRLLSARQRHWQFDQESGRLDSRRLAKLLTPRAAPRVFREEAESPVPEACVTLLVDQSGSMRGRPQRLAVQAIDIAVQTLELCRIACEVLGYTTPHGKDNPVARAWQAQGQPPHPGRLNALRHLVYKTARQPWRRNRQSLGLLLREGFGRENFDGEALDWAARRLAMRPEPRKILLVLSDAAPYDAATVAVQGRSYLESHLRKVIARIEASPIQLVAIGPTHALGYYYRQALILRAGDSVADTLFNQLGHLLTLPG